MVAKAARSFASLACAALLWCFPLAIDANAGHPLFLDKTMAGGADTLVTSGSSDSSASHHWVSHQSVTVSFTGCQGVWHLSTEQTYQKKHEKPIRTGPRLILGHAWLLILLLTFTSNPRRTRRVRWPRSNDAAAPTYTMFDMFI